MKWPANRKYQSLKGDGMQGGGQGASGMSALGGTIRLGELVGDKPIRHVIKVNPWAGKYCHYSSAIPGWKWPAKRADGYAASGYNRDGDPDIVMGSLFAIPPDVTEQSLDLKTAPGKKLFFTLQNYGAYFTEDAAWDVWDLIVERDAEIEFENEYSFSMKSDTWKAELNKLMQAVHVITNNSSSSIGGGGTPLQPLAPDFAGEVVESGKAMNDVQSFQPGNPAFSSASVKRYDLRGRALAKQSSGAVKRKRTGTRIIVAHENSGRRKIFISVK